MAEYLRAKKYVFSLLVAGLVSGISLSHAYEVVEVTDGGSLVGKVRFVGMAPPPQQVEISKDQDVCGKTAKTESSLLMGEKRGLQNVVVSLREIQTGKGFTDTPAVVDQKACQYTPHLVLVPVGKPLTILNSDGILHSVHTHSQRNPAFHRAQSKFKKELQETFLHPEVIHLTCDVHPWMSGWIIVHEHPYVTISQQDGEFELQDIPAGQYALHFWHEKAGEKTVSLMVRPGGRSELFIELGE